MTFADIHVGTVINFVYTNNDNETKNRMVYVTHTSSGSGSKGFSGYDLLAEGGYRNFNYSRLTHLTLNKNYYVVDVTQLSDTVAHSIIRELQTREFHNHEKYYTHVEQITVGSQKYVVAAKNPVEVKPGVNIDSTYIAFEKRAGSRNKDFTQYINTPNYIAVYKDGTHLGSYPKTKEGILNSLRKLLEVTEQLFKE